MSYNPQIPPQDSEELLPFLSEEFTKVAEEYNNLKEGVWGISSQMPDKIKKGMVKVFDGTNVDPQGIGLQTLYFVNENFDWKALATVDVVQDLQENFENTIEGINDRLDAMEASFTAAITAVNGRVDNLETLFTNAIGETPWTTITYSNGWSNAISSAYRRYAKGVDLIIQANIGTRADTTVIATLPVGLRPAVTCAFPVFVDRPTGQSPLPRFHVNPNGTITCHGIPSGARVCDTTIRVPL